MGCIPHTFVKRSRTSCDHVFNQIGDTVSYTQFKQLAKKETNANGSNTSDYYKIRAYVVDDFLIAFNGPSGVWSDFHVIEIVNVDRDKYYVNFYNVEDSQNSEMQEYCDTEYGLFTYNGKIWKAPPPRPNHGTPNVDDVHAESELERYIKFHPELCHENRIALGLHLNLAWHGIT